MNGRNSTHKKKLQLVVFEKTICELNMPLNQPKDINIVFLQKAETTKIPRKRLCNDIYDTCHN